MVSRQVLLLLTGLAAGCARVSHPHGEPDGGEAASDAAGPDADSDSEVQDDDPGPWLRALDVLEGTDSFDVRGVSADGSTVFGDGATGPSVTNGFEILTKTQAVAWSAAGGLVSPPVSGGKFSTAVASTRDGGTILVITWPKRGGSSVRESLRWTNGALEPIDLPYGAAVLEISHDGAVLAGAQPTTGNATDLLRWTEASGLVNLGTLNGSAVPLGMSADGSTIVGEGGPFRWTAESGMKRLPMLDACKSGHALGLSADGSVAVGAVGACSNGDRRGMAVRWTADGLENLGQLAASIPDRLNVASGVNADGSVIVGSSGGQAMIWDPENGMRALLDVLSDRGVDVDKWTLEVAVDVSSDGRTIAGNGFYDGRRAGFIAKLE